MHICDPAEGGCCPSFGEMVPLVVSSPPEEHCRGCTDHAQNMLVMHKQVLALLSVTSFRFSDYCEGDHALQTWDTHIKVPDLI